jgi:hypothetical protein
MSCHRLRAFENKALWRVFGFRDELSGGWGKLHNVELHNCCSSASTNVTRDGHRTCQMLGKDEKFA